MDNILTARMVLGTAQLGFPYGIANTTGQPDLEEATAIVSEAWSAGIIEFDTAQGYGQSEMVLGQVISELGICSKVKIITKLAPHVDYSNAAQLTTEVQRSLDRVCCGSLYALLLHDDKMLDYWQDGLQRKLSGLQETGMVQSLGVSVYSPARALQALDLPGIDIIQVPGNVFDHRFDRAGVFEKAKKINKRIYVRSVFLQGLLLMNSDLVPRTMSQARPFLRKFHHLAEGYDLSPRQLALGYSRQAFPKTGIVIGVELVEQLAANVRDWEVELPDGLLTEVEGMFGDVPEEIVNPVLWPKG